MRNAGAEAWPCATYPMFPCIRICILQHQIFWWYVWFLHFFSGTPASHCPML